MSEILDFSGATVSEGNANKYLNPGIHTVKVTTMVAGKSANKQSPYLRVTVEDANGATCSNDYYLNGGAFNISANNIVQLLMAANNITEEEAKAKLSGINTDNIADKLSPMMIGKAFAIHIAGEWVNPVDTSKQSFIKGVFGNYKFAVPASRASELRHDDSKHIKGEKANTGNVSNSGVSTTTSASW